MRFRGALRPVTPFLLAGLAFASVFTSAATAQVARQPSSAMDSLSRIDPRLQAAESVEKIDNLESALAAEVSNGWATFRLTASGEWTGFVDKRTGRLESVEGSGIPWVPGRGNSLSAADFQARSGKAQPDLVALEGLARGFLPQVAKLLGVDTTTLVLNPGRSGQPADHVWIVSFDVVLGGLPIEGAQVTFGINNGNLVQFGTENLPSPGVVAPVVKVKRAQALAALATYVGGFDSADTFLDNGSLHLLPAAHSDSRFADGFELGQGRGLLSAWQFTFKREGQTGTWRGRVDAATGAVVDFLDANEYAKATGGIYRDPYITGDEIVLPMPFTNISSGGFTNSGGLYTWLGGATTTSLNGQYVKIADTCGAISVSSGLTGDLLFGNSAGIDCTTPGTGGAGNTHAARTQFYHVDRVKEVGRGWLPTNVWLGNQLLVNVNLNMTCNAYWDGTALNFFKSGGGCANTGEIAAVSIHEYGHGLDQNDGNGSSADKGTGETYGDFTSVLLTHDSCIGSGFFTTYGARCSGYGDACNSCNGVRDIDWAQHASNTPHTVDNFTRVDCPVSGYSGPCGREGHCESYVSSEGLWDFANRDLPSPGTATAWSIVDRLWYLSRSTATKAFICTTTGTPWTSDGCGTGTYWRTMRLVDDDDGNLANGTPHSCYLYSAFNRHGMACPGDTAANTCHSGCTPPAVPTLTVTPGTNQAILNWTNSGVGIVYNVYRSETGCDVGLAKIASGVAALTYTDNAVASGNIYYYRVIAQPTGNEACAAAPTSCQTATLLPHADIYTKDLAADTGGEPDGAVGDMWVSPDIWVRNDMTAGPHQNPIFGQLNYVHVELRNRSTSVAGVNIPVKMYWAHASVGLSWPTDWHLIGTAYLPNLAASAATDVVLPWDPPGLGHYCLLSRIDTSEDPMTFAEVADIGTNTRNNNNIAWRNVNIVMMLRAPFLQSVQFIYRNPDVFSRVSRLRLKEQPTAPGFLSRGTVVINLTPDLAALWAQSGQQGSGIKILNSQSFQVIDPNNAYILVNLAGRQEFTITMNLQDTATQRGSTEIDYGFEAVQEDASTNAQLGGILYTIQALAKVN
jgi:hypothetical protein